MSSKIDKYQKIIDNKIKKYGFCNTILIRNIMNKKHAILLQNAFPILEKYIDHVHLYNGKPVKVIDSLKEEVLIYFQNMIRLKKSGINLFFTDIDKIEKLLLDELISNNLCI